MILLDDGKVVGNTEWTKTQYEIPCLDRKCDKIYLSEHNTRGRCPSCRKKRNQEQARQYTRKISYRQKRGLCIKCVKKLQPKDGLILALCLACRATCAGNPGKAGATTAKFAGRS